MTDEEHEIKVTLRDVYEMVNTQGDAIRAISAKLDLYIGLTERIADHEKRLRTAERWIFALPGSAFVLSVAGLVIAVLKA